VANANVNQTDAVEAGPVMIPGPVGELEGIWEMDGNRKPRAVAVVCHPHPLHQGSMQNKVAHTLAKAFFDCGAAVLRFNFRGVGKSEGEFDNAVGETADALAAVEWVRERFTDKSLWLGGFSFGAQVALQASGKAKPEQLVTVAPPVQRFGDTRPGRPDCPWLLLQGDADDVVESQAVLDWAAAYEPPPQIEVFPGVGHFFHGNLTGLRQRVSDFLQ